jgi:hypothetical protein
MTQSAAFAQTWITIQVLVLNWILMTAGSSEIDCKAETVFCLTVKSGGQFQTGEKGGRDGDLFFIVFQQLETHNLIRASAPNSGKWQAEIVLKAYSEKEQMETGDKVKVYLMANSESGVGSVTAFQHTSAKEPFDIAGRFKSSFNKKTSTLNVEMSKSIPKISENALIVQMNVSVDGNHYGPFKTESPVTFFKRTKNATREEHGNKDNTTSIFLWCVAGVLVILLALIIMAAIFGIRREYKTISTLKSSRASTASTS